MPGPLADPRFRRLFAAQVVALAGTGLATVALALLADRLAPGAAGAVLGTALVVKMLAYVLLAPLATAWIPRAHRKGALVALDLVRAVAAACLPFASATWQVYLLVLVLQSASAAFTPLFQATIPEILRDERDYTRALSLSRLAYDLESLLSPLLAALLLTLMAPGALFGGTAMGFVASALLVASCALPPAAPVAAEPPLARARRGLRIYLRTPRLRGLLALNLCAAAAGSMVFVNTVVMVRGPLAGDERDVAWALAAFGGGSMAVALALPRALDRLGDRVVMRASATLATAVMVIGAGAWWVAPGAFGWPVLLGAWALLGAAYAGLLTPGGRLLRRSADAAHLPDVFAAQFSLSHACWLGCYAVAGWLGAMAGIGAAFGVLALVALVAALAAPALWPAHDPEVLPHDHAGLPPGHPHLGADGARHAHVYRIDDLHPRWPR